MAWYWIVLIAAAYILLWILTTSIIAYLLDEDIPVFAASAICILWPLVWLLLFISFQATKLMACYDKELNNKKGE